MDKYITDVVQVYLSIFYFLIPLSDKPNSLMVLPKLKTNNKLLIYAHCFVNTFLTPKKHLMLNWLRKDAQLACKRCPFEG